MAESVFGNGIKIGFGNLYQPFLQVRHFVGHLGGQIGSFVGVGAEIEQFDLGRVSFSLHNQFPISFADGAGTKSRGCPIEKMRFSFPLSC